jgi:integrase
MPPRDTVVQDRKVVLAFSEFVGKDRSAGSITREEVRAWRNTIAVLPPGFRKAKAYTGLCLKEAAAKAAEVGAKGLSATTISKYVSTISPFFNWCVAEGYTSANPCDGLHYKPEKGRNRRPPFTDEQLRAILTSPLFTGFLRDGKEHQPGDRLASDWRCWIPLCCMFTGARIGEIAQLRVEDVREEHGVWLLHLRHEPTKGQRTKSGKSRAVPIHSQLRGLGFLEFVETQRQRASASGNPQLFPELRPNEREQIGARPSRFWRDYLKRTGIKGGRDGFGAHSFRHTLADKFRAAGYLDNQIGIIFGHDQRSTTAGYGTLPQGTVHMLTEIIESFAISCINTIGTTE